MPTVQNSLPPSGSPNSQKTPLELRQEEEYLAWLDHPVTRLFRAYLKSQRESLKESWANAGYVSSHDVADIYQNAGAISACSVLQQIHDLEASELYGDQDE
jgi:hypothetical protein